MDERQCIVVALTLHQAFMAVFKTLADGIIEDEVRDQQARRQTLVLG